LKVKTGFSFIELIVAIMIIGIMATIVVSRITIRGPRDIDVLIGNIARVTQLGYERAVLTGKLQRVYFDFGADNSEFRLEELAENSDGDLKDQKFVPVTIAYNKTRFAWPEQIMVKNFYIKTIDEAAQKGKWFFIMPEGISQEIIINMTDENNQDSRGLVLNPFTVRFTTYDSFQKPS
jgi:prepilin-type N-terminal cleavage/methylation domain-containing protein